MYPDNPNLLEKLVWSNVEDIQREVNNPYRQPIKVGFNIKMLIVPGFLIALVWLISVLL
jgi:hypothetical protein